MFSVVIPVFNRAHVVEETLRSVVEQTYRPIEIIVVDDGSSDGSGEVVTEWWRGHEQPELTLQVLTQQNAGAAAARNRGMEAASAPFVQFLDSDDLLLPERLARCAEAMAEEDVEMVITGFESFDTESGRTLLRFPGRVNETPLDSLVASTLRVLPLRVAFRRSLLDRLEPWRTDLHPCEDREFIERALLEARRVAVIESVLGRLRRGAGDHFTDSVSDETWYRRQLMCDLAVMERAYDRPGVREVARQSFKSYLYHMALLTGAARFDELSETYAQLARSAQARLGVGGRIRSLLYSSGIFGRRCYRVVWLFKKKVLEPVHMTITG